MILKRTTTFASYIDDSASGSAPSSRAIIPALYSTVSRADETSVFAGEGTASTSSTNILGGITTSPTVFVINKSKTTTLQLQGKFNTAAVIPIAPGEAFYGGGFDVSFGLYLATASGTADYFYQISAI